MQVRSALAERDRQIELMARSQRRLERLCEISKLLLRFETVERTVPELLALVAETLPLRSAIFIDITSAPSTLAFQAAGASDQALARAKEHAQAAFDYFLPACLGRRWQESSPLPLALPPLTDSEAERGPRADRNFVLLPLVVNRGTIFGALQVEGERGLQELDLVFVDAVVCQLASAIHRACSERVLRASEAKFAGIVAIAADAVISVDEAQRIVMYNDGAEKIFGWTRAEALGQPLDLLMAESLREAHHGHVKDFARGADFSRKMGARHPGIIGLRKSGESFPADAAISKLQVNGAWLFTVMLRDSTEQRRIEHEKAFMAEVGTLLVSTLDGPQTLENLARLVMKELADFCVIDFIDEHDVVQRLAVEAADPSKAEIAAALKREPLDRSLPHLSSVVLQSRQPLLIADVSPAHLRALSQSEEHRRLLSALAPTSIMGVPLIVRGKLLGALVVASCHPMRRYSAADLRLLVDVGERAGFALESARLYRVAQRAVQVRDDVMGIVAHDLRSPVNAIVLQAAMMRRRGGEPERRACRPVEVIERSAKRMTRLIQDLLDVTRMEAGQLSIDMCAVDASRLLSDTFESQQLLAAASFLELRLESRGGLPEVWADRDRLLQVFENLIGNAMKFTAPGGSIVVGARPQPDGVLFWVTDTGAGISAVDLPHLFDRFWQAEKVKRRGAGLGLAIVKGLVESHGGTIWVESAEGAGSTFYFKILLAGMAEDRSPQ